MEFQDVVRRRRMVRDFDDRPVPPELVERILANGTRAPSAGFTQGWEFLVLEGPDQTGRFWSASVPPAGDRSRARWPGVMRAPLLVVPFADEEAYRQRYAAPDKAAVGMWAVPYWYVDTGFAALIMLLTAVDAGLGALFFAVADPGGLRAAFGVPAHLVPVGAVAVGYPRPHRRSASASRVRRPVGEVVHRGRW